VNLNSKQFRVSVPDTVAQRQSGGKGHLEGDDSRSVVGMVSVHALKPLMEFDRAGSDADSHSAQRINEISEDIKSGKGITNPLMVAYDHQNKWGHIGEGNHRLAAAIQSGVTHVPVTVYRQSGLGEHKKSGVGGHLAMLTNFTEPGSHDAQTGKEYVPTNIHPGHFKQLMS
jgi:hypothetical protein